MDKTKGKSRGFIHSIAFRLMLVPSIGIFAAMSTGIAATLILHTILGDQNADAEMTSAVVSHSRNLDTTIAEIEQAVNGSRLFFEQYFTDAAKLSDTDYYNQFSYTLDQMLASTIGANAYSRTHWLVVNPEFTGQTPADPKGIGFFCVLNDETKTYEKKDNTNILAYDKNEVEHVGWWYSTIANPNGAWTAPYYNANIDYNLITYATPCYDAQNKLLGAVGVDLDFDLVEKALSSFAEGEFTDPRPFLLAKDHTFLSSPIIKTHDKQGHFIGTTITLESEFGSVLRHYGDMNTHFYKLNNEKYKNQNRALSYYTLGNGLVYGISVDATALYEPVNRTTAICIAIFASVTILLAIIDVVYINKELIPLRKLTDEVAQLKDGDKVLEITVSGTHEMHELTQEVHDMVGAIRANELALEALAEKDGLTGAKNANAQKEKVLSLNRDIDSGKSPKFAIVMADVNDLKHINDNLGHPEGDVAIRDMCYILCHVFAHSPVYRIGGDEFIAILENDDFRDKDVLFDALKKSATDKRRVKHTFSVGMAVFESGKDNSFADVYARADNEMYAMKDAYKKSKK